MHLDFSIVARRHDDLMDWFTRGLVDVALLHGEMLVANVGAVLRYLEGGSWRKESNGYNVRAG